MLLPGSFWKVPCEHGVQLAAPASLNVPGWHVAHDVLPAGATVPGVHCVQCRSSPVVPPLA